MLNSSMQCCVSYSILLRSFSNTHFFIKDFYNRVISPVSRLNSESRPTTVFLRIMSVVVSTIYSRLLLSKFFDMFKVRFIHIISELFKGFPQTFNSTAAVVSPRLARRNIASCKDTSVDMIKFSFSKTMGLCRRFLSGSLFAKKSLFTSTRKSFGTSCLLTFSKNYLPTNTKTLPQLSSLRIYLFGKFKECQKTVTFPLHIYSFHSLSIA